MFDKDLFYKNISQYLSLSNIRKTIRQDKLKNNKGNLTVKVISYKTINDKLIKIDRKLDKILDYVSTVR